MAMGKDETMRSRDKAMLERAVENGVRYLDANPDKEEAFQDWWRKIDLNRLNLARGDHCIIGQTLGDFMRLSQVDDFAAWPTPKLHQWAARRGFFVVDRQRRIHDYWNPSLWTHTPDTQWRDDAYAYLTFLWRNVVDTRQTVESLSESLTGASDGPADGS